MNTEQLKKLSQHDLFELIMSLYNQNVCIIGFLHELLEVQSRILSSQDKLSAAELYHESLERIKAHWPDNYNLFLPQIHNDNSEDFPSIDAESDEIPNVVL